MYLTNSLLVGVTNIPTSTNSFASASSYVFTNDLPAIFQTVGAGSHYLADNTYRNSGTTNIDPDLTTSLRKMTTYPPLELTNHFTTSTTLAPQAQRDSDVPDLGYHYSPLDYLWSSLDATNITLTLTNGVAVGIYGANGIVLRAGAKVFSDGSPGNLNEIVRYQSVQEQPLLLGGSTGTAFFDVGSPYSPWPTLRFRFTDLAVLAATQSGASSGRLNSSGSLFSELSLTHCSLRGMSLAVDPPGDDTNTVTVAFTNNVFERCYFHLSKDQSVPIDAYSYNNLFWNGTVTLAYTLGSDPNFNWEVKDNAFDNVSLTQSGNGVDQILKSNNGYVNTTSLGGTGNVSVSAFSYSRGPLGPWYHASTNFLDAGDRTADSAGLYHFTTRVDQPKETNSVVDLGFHYVSSHLTSPGPDSGMVGWWKLDETTGTSASDSSGYGYNGTLLNGPTWTSGPVAGALKFDGLNDSVSVPDATALRLGANMSIAFWMRKDADPTATVRFVGKGSSSYRNYCVWEDGSTHKVLFQLMGTNGVYLNLFSQSVLGAGTWYHVACVYNGSTAAIYLNGSLDTWMAFSGIPQTSTDPLTFGYAGWNTYHNGLLDDVRIYNRPLSASEIASLANGALWDTDGDEIPDYLEDRNGDGTNDDGETDWQTSNSAVSGAGGLQVFTPLK